MPSYDCQILEKLGTSSFRRTKLCIIYMTWRHMFFIQNLIKMIFSQIKHFIACNHSIKSVGGSLMIKFSNFWNNLSESVNFRRSEIPFSTKGEFWSMEIELVLGRCSEDTKKCEFLKEIFSPTVNFGKSIQWSEWKSKVSGSRSYSYHPALFCKTGNIAFEMVEPIPFSSGLP